MEQSCSASLGHVGFAGCSIMTITLLEMACRVSSIVCCSSVVPVMVWVCCLKLRWGSPCG